MSELARASAHNAQLRGKRIKVERELSSKKVYLGEAKHPRAHRAILTEAISTQQVELVCSNAAGSAARIMRCPTKKAMNPCELPRRV
jgi:hypothetical protein